MNNFRNRLLKGTVGGADQSSWRGVFIEDTTGKLWTIDSWDGSATFNSVAVISDTHSFGIAGEYTEQCQFSEMSSSYLLFSGFDYGRTAYKSVEEAYTDMDGELNTDRLLSAQGTGDMYAAQKCKSYTFANGNSGYLMSAGEYKMIVDHITDINRAMGKVGGAEVEINVSLNTSKGIWTSTLGTSTTKVCTGWSNISTSEVEYQMKIDNPSFADIVSTYGVYVYNIQVGADASGRATTSGFGKHVPSYGNGGTGNQFINASSSVGTSSNYCRPVCRLMNF